jgi:hypothetical protein
MPDISGFLSFFDFFSFDFAIEGWPGLSCAMGEDYYDRLLITMLTPLIMLVCVCLVSSLLLTLYKTKVNGSMLMRVGLTTITFLHTMVSAKTMGAYVSQEVNGVRYVDADTTKLYTSATHDGWLIGVSLYTVAFVFGYPLVLGVLVMFHREQMKEQVDTSGWQVTGRCDEWHHMMNG